MDKRIQKMKDSGDLLRCTRLETIAYIAHSIAQQATDEADDLLHKYGLKVGDVKYRSRFLNEAFNKYNFEVKQMLPRFGSNDLCEDYEAVRKALYQFAGLEPKDDNPSDHSAANNDQIEFGHIADNDKC